MKELYFVYFILSFIALSCQSYSHPVLDKDDTLRIKKLGLLDKDEYILKYTANYKKQVAGSFYTNKRVAHYWIDEQDARKNSVGSAYYREIKAVDTVYNTTSLTQASYLKVIKKDNSSFNVYVSGKRPEVDSFFLPVLRLWNKEHQALSQIKEEIKKSQLLGLWTDGNLDGATIDIKMDSIYYIDENTSYGYSLSGNGISIKYPDYTYKAKISIQEDTLFLYSREYGKFVFWKFKK
jgi:hypothetical protein